MTPTTVPPGRDVHIDPFPLANLTGVHDRRAFKYRHHVFSLDTLIDFGPTGRLDTMVFGVAHRDDGVGGPDEPVELCDVPCVKHMVRPIGELRLQAFSKKGSSPPEFWVQLEAMLDLYIAYYEGVRGGESNEEDGGDGTQDSE